MAKTSVERQAEFKKKQAEDGAVRLTIFVSELANSQLERLATCYRLTKRDMLEKILNDADAVPPTTRERAEELLVQCNRDMKLAKETYRRELRRRYLGFTASRAYTAKGQPFYEAGKLYKSVCRQIELLVKAGAPAGKEE